MNKLSLKTQTLKPEWWLRFIENIFMIWTAGLHSLKRVLLYIFEQFQYISEQFQALKITNSTLISSIVFLDITLKI